MSRCGVVGLLSVRLPSDAPQTRARRRIELSKSFVSEGTAWIALPLGRPGVFGGVGSRRRLLRRSDPGFRLVVPITLHFIFVAVKQSIPFSIQPVILFSPFRAVAA